jgi:hypothetical protein
MPKTDYFFFPLLPTDKASPLLIDFATGASDKRVSLGTALLPAPLVTAWFFDLDVLRLLTPLRPIFTSGILPIFSLTGFLSVVYALLHITDE